LVTDKFQVHKIWSKNLRKYCKLTNFLQRYKVDNRMYDHFYKCTDKKKKQFVSVKIINKKGLKPEQKRFVDCEIECHRRIVCPLMPTLKKVYEDDNYIYLTFIYFKGDDLLTICTSSRL
jgi:serine/threonine protein kinase